MGLQRLPNNTSLEELLSTIEKSEDKDVVGISDDVLSFISHFNIQPGENLVLTSAIFALYKNWSKDPVSRTVFGLKINKHFLKHQKGKYVYYKINLDSFSIEKQTLLELEKHKLDRTKYPTWQKHFQSFLDFYGIKKGKTWVQSFVLMYFYDKWCYKNKRKTLLSEISFFNFCKLHFEHKRNAVSRMMWFGINEDFFKQHLTPQKLKQLQKTRKEQHGKKQKRKGKISRTKTGT